MDEIVKAIANHLDSRFAPVKIYTEEVPQKAPDEYFFVNFISGSYNKLVDSRYENTMSIDIIFDAKLNQRLRIIADQLADHFRYVPFGAYPIRPSQFNQNITDGILHTIIDFNIHLFADTPLWGKMQKLYFEGGVQDG